MLNACTPCLYKLSNEPTLKYSLLVTMDGNQSLKLVDETFRHGSLREDGRAARTDIWLSRAEVDRFKDEVGAPVCLTVGCVTPLICIFPSRKLSMPCLKC